MLTMKEKRPIYPHIFPDISDWPIYKQSENRRAFVAQLVDFTVNRIQSRPVSDVTDLIARTIYMERIRIKEEPWKVDPPNERQFWKKIHNQLVDYSLDMPEDTAFANNRELLETIVKRYAEEIVGTFRIKTFLFARRFLTFFFHQLLSRLALPVVYYKRGTRKLSRRFLIGGEVETVRSLFSKGTVVVVPTHFSNLDSILIGYAMDTFAGLPSFAYGAGLNLYNTGYTAYFMNRLGAYRVDRRKKNPIYLETLKAMSNLSIQQGTNSLFFPGGTRSRSGALESRVKLGLLGTAVEAQRAMAMRGENKKVFIVPLVLGYHFVLEAQSLINQYLKREGKEHYHSRDESYSFRKTMKFLWKLFTQESEIMLSFGQPMDVLGHGVDAEGKSYDQYGNLIDVAAYFKSGKGVNKDLQRESQYTRILSERLVERYFRDNIVLSSHLVAHAAFLILKRDNPKLDLFGLLRLPSDEYLFQKEHLYDIIRQLQVILTGMEAKGKVKQSDPLKWPVEELVDHGIARLGTFHVNQPLRKDKKGNIVSDNFKLLYYYHNRLEHYGLESRIDWNPETEAKPTPAQPTEA